MKNNYVIFNGVEYRGSRNIVILSKQFLKYKGVVYNIEDYSEGAVINLDLTEDLCKLGTYEEVLMWLPEIIDNSILVKPKKNTYFFEDWGDEKEVDRSAVLIELNI